MTNWSQIKKGALLAYEGNLPYEIKIEVKTVNDTRAWVKVLVPHVYEKSVAVIYLHRYFRPMNKIEEALYKGEK